MTQIRNALCASFFFFALLKFFFPAMVKQQGSIATPAVMITLLQMVSDPFMNNDVGNTDDDIFGYESMLQCILR